ncbi:hypothetical protein CsSME_00053681 [Camellia sinensis var. sinensis]|uniref:RNase H type-1 domain-containing protein n=1 Tax=Camellia sinensis TaxID=4442 RepID=A0A7J7FZX4_CAMSI|nr:hypothetical protein HYC85_030161 [Camellia sinensis]
MARAEFDSATNMGAFSYPQVHAAIKLSVANWVPLSSGKYKINCNMVVKKDSNQIAVAVILRDSNEQMIDGLTQKCCISSSFRGEALACLLACQLA